MARKGAATGGGITQQHVQCAHEDCGISALCRIKTKTGWANLCWQHYDQHYAEEALANLDRYGLAREADETSKEWVDRMRKFVRTSSRLFIKRHQRVRGEVETESAT